MALIGADPGAEYYRSRTLTQAIAEGALNAGTQIDFTTAAPTGRATTFCIHSGGGAGVLIGRTFGGNPQDVTVGWAVYNGSTAWALVNVASFRDATTDQVQLRMTATGQFQFTRNGTNIGGLSANVLTTGWHFFEVKLHIASGTNGTAELRVDNTVWLTVTGVSTQATGNAYVQTWNAFPIVQNQNQYYKDFYWRNDSTYLGDQTVNVIYMNAAGPSQQFTPSSGTQVSCIQDGITGSGTVPDDSNYISDTVSGHISDFVPQAITVPGGSSIKARIHVSRLRGPGSVKQYTKSGATVHTTGTLTPGSTPFYLYDVMETDPNTGSAWTQSGTNAATDGVQVP